MAASGSGEGKQSTHSKDEGGSGEIIQAAEHIANGKGIRLELAPCVAETARGWENEPRIE